MFDGVPHTSPDAGFISKKLMESGFIAEGDIQQIIPQRDAHGNSGYMVTTNSDEFSSKQLVAAGVVRPDQGEALKRKNIAAEYVGRNIGDPGQSTIFIRMDQLPDTIQQGAAFFRNVETAGIEVELGNTKGGNFIVATAVPEKYSHMPDRLLKDRVLKDFSNMMAQNLKGASHMVHPSAQSSYNSDNSVLSLGELKIATRKRKGTGQPLLVILIPEHIASNAGLTLFKQAAMDPDTQNVRKGALVDALRKSQHELG